MNKTKIVLLAAGTSLAMAFTLGCGGPKTVADVKGDQEIVSPSTKLLKLCNDKFIDKNFCGIGQGKSNSESMATQIATTNAKSELAASVQTTIEAKTKVFGMNDPDGNALEGAAMRAIANVSQEITDIRKQEEFKTYNEAEKQYTVYVLVTSARDAALELAKQKLRTSQELVQIQQTLNLNANVERILDQEPTQVKPAQ